MRPINLPPSMDPSQRALDEKNALDRRLSNGVGEKTIEHDPVKEAYKNFSIEKEGTSLITSLKNGFKNFADLILKPLGFETFQESSVKKNNEKYFNAGGPDYLNEPDPEKQKTQPQDNKSQKPKEGFFVAAFKKIFKVTSVPKQVRDDIKIINTNPKIQFNFTKPEDGATIEVNPVSEVVISNQSREASSRFEEYRKRAEKVMAERGVSDGIKWEERVLATDPDRNKSRDPNSGVEAPSNSSSGQGLDSAKPSSKTPQPPQSLAQIIPTEERKERLRAAILKRLGQEGGENSAPESSKGKLETSQTPLDRSIKSLVSKTEKLKVLVLGLQTSTTSLEPQQNNVQEPKDELRGSETLIGAPLNAPPKETTTTATSSSTRTSSTPTPSSTRASSTPTSSSTRASSTPTPSSTRASSTPTSATSEEESQQISNGQRTPSLNSLPKLSPVANPTREQLLNTTPLSELLPRYLDELRAARDNTPPNKTSQTSYSPKTKFEKLSTDSQVSHSYHTRGFDRNGPEISERMAKAQEAEKALAELEALKAQKKAPSRQTQAAKQQSLISPCGHKTYASRHSPGGETSFVASLTINGTGGKGGRGAGG